MKRVFLKIIINTIAIFIVDWLLSGIELTNSFTAVAVAVALALLNSFLRPLLILLTVPLTVMTMGVFVLFINAGIVLLAGELVEGFMVRSFATAFWFSILMYVVGFFLELPEKIRQRQIIFKRIIADTENPDAFFDEMSQKYDDPKEFQDAEIVDEEEKDKTA